MSAEKLSYIRLEDVLGVTQIVVQTNRGGVAAAFRVGDDAYEVATQLIRMGQRLAKDVGQREAAK